MPGPAFARRIADVPVLIAEPEPSDGPHPVVFWHHGFRADALAHAHELERCAAAGFLAIGVDAVGHGARRYPDMDERLASSLGGALPVMLDCVTATIAELPGVLQAIGAEYAIDRSRISMVGISMGAFLCYGAIGAGFPLRSAVALLGSPEWLRPNSPHHQLFRFQPVALLSITAELDESVPPEPTRRLHAALRHTFPQSARHHHHELAGAGHLTNATQWAKAMDATVRWLEKHG
jgi:uncharacterized protein